MRLIHTSDKNLYAKVIGVFGSSTKNPEWRIYNNGTFHEVRGTKDNQAAARKQLKRLEAKLPKVLVAKVKKDSKESIQSFTYHDPNVLTCMVPELIAEKSSTKDINGRSNWHIFYSKNLISVVSCTKNNRDATRKRLARLELLDDADLQKMSKDSKWPKVNQDQKPKSKNSSVQIILRFRGPEDQTDTTFSLGEFVHSDNAVKRFKALKTIIQGLESLVTGTVS